MSFEIIRPIPQAEEIRQKIFLSEALKRVKDARDLELRDIFEGKSNKFLVIVGPCSAHDEDAVVDYALRLAQVQEKVKEKLFLVPRVYTNKPRTTGEGYKGMLHQPDPNQEPNMVDGIIRIRKMHARVIEETGLAPADEMLYPDNLGYVEDMLSYIAIGARSVENQEHRLAASGISVPVGMKNPTSGDLQVMFNSIIAAQASHNFIYQGAEVKTSGNPLCHAILRGSVSKHGENIPNYHYEDLLFASALYVKHNLLNPMIVVDTNHANSRKQYAEQPRIAKEVLHSRKYNTVIQQMVRGIMLESYIAEGSQSISENVYGKSITDACLGWPETEKLLYYMAENV